MTEESGKMGQQPDAALEFVVAALSARAASAGLRLTMSPGLVGDVFDGGRGEPSASLDAGDLPAVSRGLTIGRHSVVLGLLPETTDEYALVGLMRQHRNQCVVARSALSPNAALDLLLIMVGPRGSAYKDSWRAVALGIERDDRVARKLVWLRPDDPADDSDGFEAFIKRTFLARPWKTGEHFSVATLDDIAADLDTSNEPTDTAGAWTRLAIERGDEPDSLVDGLIDVWKRRSAP